MASEAAGNREDVEQTRRRFEGVSPWACSANRSAIRAGGPMRVILLLMMLDASGWASMLGAWKMDCARWEPSC
jgi:hypothetical protein